VTGVHYGPPINAIFYVWKANDLSFSCSAGIVEWTYDRKWAEFDKVSDKDFG